VAFAMAASALLGRVGLFLWCLALLPDPSQPPQYSLIMPLHAFGYL